MKKVSILGSTGSVGCQAVDVISRFYREKIKVDALSCNSNCLLLAQQIVALSPERVFVSDEAAYKKLKLELRSKDTEVILNRDIDVGAVLGDNAMIIIALSGIEGLLPMYSAIKRGIAVATSNKDSLVCGGELLLPYVDRIIPLDSEHHAISKLLHQKPPESVLGVTLTASGGPFFQKEKKDVTVAEALAHPIWKMGKKNSIDSATMMNKVLEVIEAHYLFRIPKDKISVLVHPEALVHGMVDFTDGSQHAFISSPDMRVGINNALAELVGNKYKGSNNYGRVSLGMKKLTFYPAEEEEFPVLKFLTTDQEITLNAMNDLAVVEFLAGRLAFCSIPEFIAVGIERFRYNKGDIKSVDDVLSVYEEVQHTFSDFRGERAVKVLG